jgi:hypothetical protein
MLADQASQVSGKYYYNLETNRNYEYNGVANGLISDYTLRTVAQRDYTTFAGVGNTGASFSPAEYTYWDVNGNVQDEIVQFHGYWSNQRSAPYLAICLIGAELDDDFLIDHSKLFYEETLKYAVFPDGSDAEFRRNGDSGYVMQGTHTYSVIVSECMINIAQTILDNKGENIYTWETTDGRFGTGGSTKNLKLVIDELVTNCTAQYLDADSKYYQSVSDANLLDTVSNTDTRRFLSELILSYANRYYNDAALNGCYMLTSQGSNPYTGNLITGVHPWGGQLQTLPSAGFMYHETEPTTPTTNRNMDKRLLL